MAPVGTDKRHHDTNNIHLAETGTATAPRTIDSSIPQWKWKSSLVVYLLLAFSYLLSLILFGIVLAMGANLPAEVTKVYKKLQETQDLYPCGSRSREWEYFDGRCYHFSIKAVPWPFARAQCEEQYSTLVVIQEEAKQNFIQSRCWGKAYWIGLTDQDVEGQWKWIDGTDYRTNFKKWKIDEPKDHEENADCAEIHTAGEWNVEKCNERRLYVCEKPLPS